VALRRFTEKIGEEMTITQQSLSEARDKIKWEAFAELSEKAEDSHIQGVTTDGMAIRAKTFKTKPSKKMI